MLLLLLAFAASLIVQSVSFCDLESTSLNCDGESLEDVISKYSSIKDTIISLEISYEETGILELRRKNLPFPSLRKLQISHGLEELADGCFKNLKQLKILSLTKNLITEFPQEALENNVLEKLDLSHNKISRIDKVSHLDNLFELNLSSNKIALIQGSAFQNLSNLTDLDLSNNNIFMLGAALFEGMKKLEFVNLGMNKLETIPSEIFDNNLFLRNLILSRNDFIRGINDDFLSKNNRLLYLDLSGSGFKEVTTQFLRNLTSLKHLNLENSPMGPLKFGVFGKLVNIERMQLSKCSMWKFVLLFRTNVELNYLDISYNKLETLPEALFKTNYKLSFLNISGNRLRDLPFRLLHSTVLKTIDLSYNRFSKVDWYDLNIPTLENLHLRGNEITELKPYFIDSLNLKYFDLRDNSLFYVEGDFYKQVPRLVWFEFLGNPFNCKCLEEILVTIPVKNIGFSKDDYFDGIKPICVVQEIDCIKNISFYKSNFKDFTT